MPLALGRALLLVSLLGLAPASCGFNLLQVRRDLYLQASGARWIPCEVWLRAGTGWATEGVGSLGAGSGGGNGGTLLLVIVCVVTEAVDAVGNTGAAVYAMCDGDVAVKYGPFGWLFSLLPGITLMPEAIPELPFSLRVTDADLAQLQSEDADVVCSRMDQLLEPHLDGVHAHVQSVRLGEVRSGLTAPWWQPGRPAGSRP